MTTGSLEFVVGGQTYKVEPGDTLHFPGIIRTRGATLAKPKPEGPDGSAHTVAAAAVAKAFLPRGNGMTEQRKPRVGIYVFNGAEVVDWAAPFGVMAVARRLDPEIDVFLISDSGGPVVGTGNMVVTPRYGLDHRPSMTAFVIPGGIGTRTEIHNRRLLEFVRTLESGTRPYSVCTGSWVYGVAGLLDGLPATSRKEADPSEPVTPLDRLKTYAPEVEPSRARIVDAGSVVTAGGISSGMELGFYLLELHGYDDAFVFDVARIMEYQRQWELMRDDRLVR
ncbi:MAG: DJ-1/PfpI family protein [Streptosporangiaceae bacterium]